VTTRTSSRAALLHIAVQDLHGGKLLLARRLPVIAGHGLDTELVAILGEDAARAEVQAEGLCDTGVSMAGPVNLWMPGILDDAERDTQRHQPGVVLDIALVGAIRKAKAAEIVLAETAIALARALDHGALLAVLEEQHRADVATDAALARRLAALSHTR